MDLICDYSWYTLENLQKIEDMALRNILIQEYHDFYFSMFETPVLQKLMAPYYGSSLDKLFEKFDVLKASMTSLNLFPGDLVQFYSWYKTYQSKTFFVDDLGCCIFPKTRYLSYRPMLWNLTTNVRYVLKRTLKVEEASIEILPTTLLQFEVLDQNIRIREEEPYLTLCKQYDNGFVLQRLR